MCTSGDVCITLSNARHQKKLSSNVVYKPSMAFGGHPVVNNHNGRQV